MNGTILYKILHKRIQNDQIDAEQVISIPVDHIIFPDNCAREIFKLLDAQGVQEKLSPSTMLLTNMNYQNEPGYSFIQKDLISKAKKRSIRCLEKNMGLWHFLIAEEIQHGSVWIARDSTINLFAPYNNLNISSGIQDIVYSLITGHHDFYIPQVVKVELEGRPSPNITGKDISLYLIQELQPYLSKGHFAVEFSGSLIDQLSADDLFALSAHHYAMFAYMFLFPPLKHIPSTARGIIADPNANYVKTFRYDVSKLTPMCEKNGTITDVCDIPQTPIDSVYIGNLIGGSLNSLKWLAENIKGKKVKIPCYVIPASQAIMRAATSKGYMDPIMDSGCIILSPSTTLCSVTNGQIPLDEETIVSTGINDVSLYTPTQAIRCYTASIQTALSSALNGHISSWEIKS